MRCPFLMFNFLLTPAGLSESTFENSEVVDMEHFCSLWAKSCDHYFAATTIKASVLMRMCVSRLQKLMRFLENQNWETKGRWKSRRLTDSEKLQEVDYKLLILRRLLDLFADSHPHCWCLITYLIYIDNTKRLLNAESQRAKEGGITSRAALLPGGNGVKEIMGKKCFVPNCTNGYESCKGKALMFRAPKKMSRLQAWQDAIECEDLVRRPEH